MTIEATPVTAGVATSSHPAGPPVRATGTGRSHPQVPAATADRPPVIRRIGVLVSQIDQLPNGLLPIAHGEMVNARRVPGHHATASAQAATVGTAPPAIAPATT